MSDNPFRRSKHHKEDFLRPPFDIDDPNQHKNENSSASLSLNDSNTSPRASFGFGSKKPVIHERQMESFVNSGSSSTKTHMKLIEGADHEKTSKFQESNSFQVPNNFNFEGQVPSPMERIRKSSFYQSADFSNSSEKPDFHQISANQTENQAQIYSLKLEEIEEKTEGGMTPKFNPNDFDDKKLAITNFLDLGKTRQQSENQKQNSMKKEVTSVSFQRRSEEQEKTMQRKPAFIEANAFEREYQFKKKEIRNHQDEKSNHIRRDPICYGCGEKHYLDHCPQRFASNDFKCFNCKKLGHIAKNCPEPRKCSICGNTDHIARNCPSEETIRRFKICINCNQTGHFGKDCTKPRKCFLCHQVGHQIKDCPKNKKNKMDSNLERILKPTVCFNCRKEGHYADDCPEPEKCYKCGREGHFSRDCPHMAVRSRSVDESLKEEEKVEKKESLEKPASEPEVRKAELLVNLNFIKKSIKKSKQKSSKNNKASKNPNIGKQWLKDLRK